MGKEPDYSLWNVEFSDEADNAGNNVVLWPYDGADSEDLKKQLLEDFIEHAFDED